MEKKRITNDDEPRLIDYVALGMRAKGWNPTLDSDGEHYTYSGVTDIDTLRADIDALLRDETLFTEAMNIALAQGHRLLTRADASSVG